ncbi:MAG: helix-turn-helix transcriptional regulator [Acutalibacter sp.]|jgi:DNA-binding XRE family transcriptional regulator
MNTRLRDTREKRGKTQQEIADFAGISLKSYQRIEKGVQDPAVSTALLIAKTLKNTVEKLFG